MNLRKLKNKHKNESASTAASFIRGIKTKMPTNINRLFDRSKWYLKFKDRVDFPKDSIILITIDSLRYDVAQTADTPNFKKLFARHGGGWHKVGSHGTYTLPSHISMFHAGMMPCDNSVNTPAPFNRLKQRLFKAQLAWERTTGAKFPTPAAENIIKGFEKIGYRTIGVGGVGWFNDKFPTSDIWRKKYFNEFYWEERFSEKNFDSLKHQIELIQGLKLRAEKKPIFLFLNISCTHKPYMNFGDSLSGQRKSFEQVDKLLPSLIKALPEKCHLMILSDHGECFGEDNLWGHGFYHPKIMEIPFAYIIKK